MARTLQFWFRVTTVGILLLSLAVLLPPWHPLELALVMLGSMCVGAGITLLGLLNLLDDTPLGEEE